MTWLRKVLLIKAVLTLVFWVLPLLFLPAGLFPDLGIPTWTPAANVFLRLLGGAYLAIALVEIWGFIDSVHRRSAALLGLVSSSVTSIVLCRDIFYGELWNWGLFGWALMLLWLLLYTLFAIALLVTGLPTLLGRAETSAPAPTSPSDVRPPLPPY
ncbi:hypothetical protein K2Z84_24080 [Candidatus Binatia bacterium]|nr:hypothetical protein [Candidatus Binatia bacterium]